MLKKDTPANMAAYKPALDEVWNLFGPDRVVYGSNWPVSDKLAPYGHGAQHSAGLRRDPRRVRRAQVLPGKSKACYKWVERT